MASAPAASAAAKGSGPPAGAKSSGLRLVVRLAIAVISCLSKCSDIQKYSGAVAADEPCGPSRIKSSAALAAKMIRFPPSPRDNFQNYAGLRGQDAASQPCPALSRSNKPSTCGFNFTIGTMVASWRFSPVNRYSCDLVAFPSKPNSLTKRKKPDLRMEIGLIGLSKAEPTRSNDP